MGTDEQGREVYRWIEGEAGVFPIPAELASETALTALARVIREIHDASVNFRAKHRTWDELLADPTGSEEIVCHNDVSVPNTIYRAGLPIAIVDWEFLAPGSRSGISPTRRGGASHCTGPSAPQPWGGPRASTRCDGCELSVTRTDCRSLITPACSTRSIGASWRMAGVVGASTVDEQSPPKARIDTVA